MVPRTDRLSRVAPELLLLDEPTAALDRASARAIVTLLRDLAGADVTVLAATHDQLMIEAASETFDLSNL